MQKRRKLAQRRSTKTRKTEQEETKPFILKDLTFRFKPESAPWTMIITDIPLTVFVHVGPQRVYSDISWIPNALNTIWSCGFKNIDIVITVSDSNVKAVQHLFQQIVSSEMWKRIHVLPVANRGMDIGGFMEGLLYYRKSVRHTHKHYTKEQRQQHLFLKLHTKRSEKWRKQLVDSIVGNKERIKTILHIFIKFQDIALIGSSQHALPLAYNVKLNEAHLNDILKRRKFCPSYRDLSTRLRKDSETLRGCAYIGGTMFWMRMNILDTMLTDGMILAELQKLNTCSTLDANWYVQQRVHGKQNIREFQRTGLTPEEHYRRIGEAQGWAKNLLHYELSQMPSREFKAVRMCVRDGMREHAWERMFPILAFLHDEKKCKTLGVANMKLISQMNVDICAVLSWPISTTLGKKTEWKKSVKSDLYLRGLLKETGFNTVGYPCQLLTNGSFCVHPYLAELVRGEHAVAAKRLRPLLVFGARDMKQHHGWRAVLSKQQMRTFLRNPTYLRRIWSVKPKYSRPILVWQDMGDELAFEKWKVDMGRALRVPEDQMDIIQAKQHDPNIWLDPSLIKKEHLFPNQLCLVKGIKTNLVQPSFTLLQENVKLLQDVQASLRF